MEIRLLGRFELLERGRGIVPGALRQRAVLAALALAAGHAIPTGELIDALWGDAPPRTAGKSLQVYVSNLRRILGPGRISTEGAGYRLDLSVEHVDALRFERLVRLGLQEDIEPAARAIRLRDALAVWRGPALAEFEGMPFTRVAGARLEERRIEAVEGLLRAEVELGRGPEVLAEIESAVAEQPLREGLTAIHMQALYQAGRQADALAAYHRTRRLLDTELGVDPGPELQRLESAVLRQEAHLGPHVDRSPSPDRRDERKLVTVVHLRPPPSDTVDEDDPERSIAATAELLRVAASDAERAGAHVESLASGALTAVFGAPAAMEDHAFRALDLVTRLRDSLGADRIRAGVATGHVIVRTATDGSALASGPTVSRAVELAHLAGTGEIVVDGRTASVTAGRFELDKPDWPARQSDVRVVGSHRAAPAEPVQPLVGRLAELGRVLDAYREGVAAGTPRLLVLFGDAGIGKTRLLEEALQRLAGERVPPRRVVGRCIPSGEAPTYAAGADVVRSLTGLRPGATPREIATKLAAHPDLGPMVGLDVEADLDPLEARDRLHEAWIALVQEHSLEPIVLAIEDLHLAQPPMLDLLELLAQRIEGPLLIVATARPEFVDHWADWRSTLPRAAASWLEPLSSTEIAALVENMLAGQASPELQAALAPAEGNPFFAEELLRDMRDDRRLVQRDRRWELVATVDGARSQLPDSVHATLAARVDRLPAEAKATLEAAAVVGRTFWVGAVASALQAIREPARMLVDESIDQLSVREFVGQPSADPSRPGERELVFKHELTREVVYGSIPRARLAVLHGAVGGWLARAAHDDVDVAEMVANHFAIAAEIGADLGPGEEHRGEVAGQRRNALVWLERAATQATSRFNLHAARSNLERALALGTTGPEAARLWRALAEVAVMAYDGEAYWRAMEGAIHVTPGASERALLYGQMAEVSAIRRGMWRRMPPSSKLEQWIETALRHAPARSTAEGLAVFARAYIADRGPARTRDVERAGDILETHGDPILLAHGLGLRARDAIDGFRFDTVPALIHRQLDAADRIRNLDEQSLVLQQTTAALIGCGLLAEADDLTRRLEELALRLSPHHRVHSIAARAELSHLVAPAAATAALGESVAERADANRETPCMNAPFVLLLCAAAAAESGDDMLAAQLLDDAESHGMEGYDAELDGPRMRLAIVRGDRASLAELMQTSFEVRWNTRFMETILPIYLDALVVLGDRARIEREAVALAPGPSLFQPFARRALAIAGADEAAIDRAQAIFLAMGLVNAAAETNRLVSAFAEASRPAPRTT